MPKHAILFGAGASHGSDISGTPPLGSGLFDALCKFNPDSWGSLPNDIALSFRGDFEAGMRNLSQACPQAMPPLQRAMAAYFFTFLPKTTNLYITLAQEIRQNRWRGTLVTLNYERLLENSLLHAGIRPVVNMEPNNAKEIELCFPHGCCHLFCESVRGLANAIQMSGTAVQTQGPIAVVADSIEFRDRIVSDAFPPVMSFFEPQKKTLSGANFIQGQRDRWETITQEASIVGLIGIRVRRGDEHIWRPLENTPAKLVYCSGSNASAAFEEWAAEVRPNMDNLVIRSYFPDAFEQVCEEMKIRNASHERE